MTCVNAFSLVSGVLQLTVPSYSLRLVRRFGTQQVGWFVVVAFASLALVHLVTPLKSTGAALPTGTLDVAYAIASVLLVIGLGHIETLCRERQRTGREEARLRSQCEADVRERMAELVQANQELTQAMVGREQAARALAESEAQYRFLFTDNPQPMWVVDLRSLRFLAVNKAALRLYGYTSADFLALTARDLLTEAAGAAFALEAARPCAGAEPRGQWRHRREDQTWIEVEVTGQDIKYGASPARLILVNDIGRRRRRELEQCESHKADLVGQIAGGVAHHFNNLLAVVEGHTDVLLHQATDPKVTDQLQRISLAVSRASGLTRQLLIAGGRNRVEPGPLELNSTIKRLSSRLHRLVGENIQLDQAYAPRLPLIIADGHLVEHIVVSLVLNARDAIEGGGTIAIETAAVRFQESDLVDHPQARPGEFVRLTVRDTGSGMTPEVQARLFEPFFTTRGFRQGTGLGLAGVQGIVRTHSGWIELKSEVGAGTEFRIFFPAAPATIASQAVPAPAAHPAMRGTLLLVEPDDRARGLARHILSQEGYTVVEADCAATALLLWDGIAASVKLMVTSITLPGDLSGPALAECFRQNRPDLKAIFTANPDPATEAPDAVAPAGSQALLKPYSKGTLLRAVQECLGVKV